MRRLFTLCVLGLLGGCQLLAGGSDEADGGGETAVKTFRGRPFVQQLDDLKEYAAPPHARYSMGIFDGNDWIPDRNFVSTNTYMLGGRKIVLNLRPVRTSNGIYVDELQISDLTEPARPYGIELVIDRVTEHDFTLRGVNYTLVVDHEPKKGWGIINHIRVMTATECASTTRRVLEGVRVTGGGVPVQTPDGKATYTVVLQGGKTEQAILIRDDLTTKTVLNVVDGTSFVNGGVLPVPNTDYVVRWDPNYLLPVITQPGYGSPAAEAEPIAPAEVHGVVLIRVGSGLGSGAVVDARRGLIVTNRHVVESAKDGRVMVRGYKGPPIPGKVIASHPTYDLALVKMDRTHATLRTLKWADRLPPQGAPLRVVGHPSGQTWTLTKGVVSAYRKLAKGARVNDHVQTDAPSSGGNSGGPILDAEGRIVGIVAFKYFGGSNVVEGMSFGILKNVCQEFVAKHGQ